MREDEKQIGEAVREFFCERMFGAYYMYQDGTAKWPQIEIASGFCLVHRDVPLFITAAHYLVSLEKRLEKKQIIEAAIGVPSKPKTLLRYNLDIEELSAYHYWEGDPSIDLAIGPCPIELQKAMYQGDAKAIKLNGSVNHEQKGAYILFGYAAEQSKAKMNDLFYLPENGEYRMLKSLEMKSMAPRLAVLSPPTIRNDGMLESTIESEDISNCQGFSGGFVIKLLPGKQIRDYEFVGIQSGQRREGEKMKAVYFTSSENVIECLDSFLDSLPLAAESKSDMPNSSIESV